MTETRAQAGTAMSLLGEMVWLYSHSKIHQRWHIASVQQWLVPAIAHKSFRIYREKGKPVGLVTWTRLDAKTETAYVRNPASLVPDHWNSGDRLWGLDFIAPFGHTQMIVHDLRTNLFPTEVGRFLRAKEGSDTLRIMYVHGADAVKSAQDRAVSPSVQLH